MMFDLFLFLICVSACVCYSASSFEVVRRKRRTAQAQGANAPEHERTAKAARGGARRVHHSHARVPAAASTDADGAGKLDLAPDGRGGTAAAVDLQDAVCGDESEPSSPADAAATATGLAHDLREPEPRAGGRVRGASGLCADDAERRLHV